MILNRHNEYLEGQVLKYIDISFRKVFSHVPFLLEEEGRRLVVCYEYCWPIN